MKYILIIAALTLISCGKDNHYTPPTDSEKIVGTWAYSEGKDVYTFNSDSECTLNVWIDGNEIAHKDSYTIKDGVLSFSKVKTQCTVTFYEVTTMYLDCDKDGPLPPATLIKK